jgi:hypothetical protein
MTSDLRAWLLGDIDETFARLQGQVLAVVPLERQAERVGEGNSIVWATYHVARHGALALAVLGATPATPALVSGEGGGGLEEDEQPWSTALDPADVGQYVTETIARTRELVAKMDLERLDAVPEGIREVLTGSGVDRERYPWLYAMWLEKPAAFFVRWPLLGHLTNHVGEMLATRNRMGLSPF